MRPSAVSWTDCETLSSALAEATLPPILVLGGTGDEAMALAAAGAPRVRLADLDASEHALLSLKRASVELLPPQSTRALFGMDAAGRRVWFYHYVRERLDPASQAYWDAHEDRVRAGIVDSGDDEHHLARARAHLERWVHPAERTRELLACCDLDAQRDFLDRTWRTRRWSLWLRAFFPARTRARARALEDVALAGAQARVQRVLFGAELRPGASWAWSDDARHAALKAALPRVHADPPGVPSDGEIFPAVILAARPLGDDHGERDRALARAAARCAPGGRVAWWSTLDPEPPLPPELAPVDLSDLRDTSLCGVLRVAERA